MVDHLPRPRRLREFDERYTVPLGGYRSADDYYQQTSVLKRLRCIELPTRIIAAANDPIVPIEPLLTAELGSQSHLLATGCGGHLGFVGRRGDDPDRYWLDWRVIEWVLGDLSANSSANEMHKHSPLWMAPATGRPLRNKRHPPANLQVFLQFQHFSAAREYVQPFAGQPRPGGLRLVAAR